MNSVYYFYILEGLNQVMFVNKYFFVYQIFDDMFKEFFCFF